MKTLKLEYPCGMKLEVKAFSILTLILGWWGIDEDSEGSKILCPLHGKDCEDKRE